MKKRLPVLLLCALMLLSACGKKQAEPVGSGSAEETLEAQTKQDAKKTGKNTKNTKETAAPGAAAAPTNGKSGSKNSGGKTSTKIDKALSEQFSANQGKLPWPAEGRVVSHFGRSSHPVYTKVEMPFNNGVGLAVDRDAPVKAVFNGTVKQIVMIPGYNQCVLVQHGEYFTFYCKLGSVGVKSGDKVKTGQILGHVATMGDETQLHFQLWKGKTPMDPEKWLRK
jgi:murein DD-endopeptidase MepM/ murein hydrolase activator NlpD